MTMTVETTPEIDTLLQQEAARRGLSADEFGQQLLQEALEDLQDAADADRILATSNPTQNRSLEELRKAVRG